LATFCTSTCRSPDVTGFSHQHPQLGVCGLRPPATIDQQIRIRLDAIETIEPAVR
jgi:hypothetical protein